MTYSLAGKRAIVTGAAGGIGRQTATQLAAAGAAVYINAIDADAVAVAAAGAGVGAGVAPKLKPLVAAAALGAPRSLAAAGAHTCAGVNATQATR